MSDGIWLPNYIKAELRTMEEEAPSFHDLFDKAQNLWIDYYVQWGQFPKFIYLKLEVWEHPGNVALRDYVKKMKIQPRAHKAIPWWVCVMHTDDIHPMEIARRYAKRTPMEAIEQGYMVEV
jgi:hypothetical protein